MSALFPLVQAEPTEEEITASVALAQQHTGRWSTRHAAYRCECGHTGDSAMGIARHRHRLLIIHARKDPR